MDLHHGKVVKEDIREQTPGSICEGEELAAQQGDQVDAEHSPKQRALRGTET